MYRPILKISNVILICLFSLTAKAASWPDEMRITFRCVNPMNGTYYMDNYGLCDFSMNFDVNGTYVLSRASENKWMYTDPDPSKRLTRTCQICNPSSYCGTWTGFVIEVTINDNYLFQVFAHPVDYNAAYFLGSDSLIQPSTSWFIPIENGFQTPSVFEGGYPEGIGAYGGDALIRLENMEGVCGDINGDGVVNEDDYLMVIRDIYNSNPRSMGLFAEDGPHIDIRDVFAYDWWLNIVTERGYRFCELPMVPCCPNDGYLTNHSPTSTFSFNGAKAVVLAKCGGGSIFPGLKMKDALFPLRGRPFLDVVGKEEIFPDRGNMRILESVDGNLYVINSRSGISRLSPPGGLVIPPARFTISHFEGDPIYGLPATIYVGIQERWIPTSDPYYQIPNIYGRPILDADLRVGFDPNTGRFYGYAYIAPVVVDPEPFPELPDRPPYEAAAKIILEPGSNPPYSIVKLYVPEFAEYGEKVLDVVANVDYAGWEENVIILTSLPQVTKFDASSGVQSAYLAGGYPVAMTHHHPGVYVACSGGNGSSYVYYLNGQAFDGYPIQPPIIINNMSYVTDISGNWVVGFSFFPGPPPPSNPTSSGQPFYMPKLARLGEDANAIELYSAPYYDIALPLSVAYVSDGGPNWGSIGRIDYNYDGIINFIDYAFASNQSPEEAYLVCMYWLERESESGDEDYNRDGIVNFIDYAYWGYFNLTTVADFCQRWLEEEP